MTQAPSATQPPHAARQRSDSASNAALAVAMLVAVPFAVTGLFRLGLSPLAVLLVCLAAAGGLWAMPRRGRWLAIGWLAGCALWAVALALIIWQFGQGMQGLD